MRESSSLQEGDMSIAKRIKERTKGLPSKGILVPSRWEQEIGRWDEKRLAYLDRETLPIEGRQVRILIENWGEGEILRFENGPTGHETYYLVDLLPWLQGKDTRRPRCEDLAICAGTINSWPRCTVQRKDLVAALKELGRL
jgi:hypothetical protein